MTAQDQHLWRQRARTLFGSPHWRVNGTSIWDVTHTPALDSWEMVSADMARVLHESILGIPPWAVRLHAELAQDPSLASRGPELKLVIDEIMVSTKPAHKVDRLTELLDFTQGDCETVGVAKERLVHMNSKFGQSTTGSSLPNEFLKDLLHRGLKMGPYHSVFKGLFTKISDQRKLPLVDKPFRSCTLDEVAQSAGFLLLDPEHNSKFLSHGQLLSAGSNSTGVAGRAR